MTIIWRFTCSLVILFARLFCMGQSFSSVAGGKYPIYGPESLMKAKSHGTCETGVQSELRWNCDSQLADRICCHNRHYAEHSGYFTSPSLRFINQLNDNPNEVVSFYDSVSGKLLFTAPRGRSMADFIKESRAHGWPSFRDEEVNWAEVRCLKGGEAVSLAGTHLGHNLPDRHGNRYCINLVSVAGIGAESSYTTPAAEQPL